jgi:hypothetical protein
VSAYVGPQPAARREPPWWVVLIAVPLFLTSIGFALAAAIGGIGLIGSVTADKRVSATQPLASGGSVTIDVTQAAVDIRAGADGEVTVDDRLEVRSPTRSLARLALGAFTPATLTATPAGVRVEVTSSRLNPFASVARHTLTISVPAGAQLTLTGEGVAANVRDLSGPIDFNVGAGAVHLQNMTVTGSDRITASSGAIDFNGAMAGGRLDVSTDSGAIHVRVPRGTNATYDVSTTSGPIFVRPESGQSQGQPGGAHSLSGMFGSGDDGSITLHATAGLVSLEAA